MKKALIRNQQWFAQKVLKKKKTVDEEFNRLYARISEIEDTTKETIKHINQLIENFFAMSTTLQYVGEDFKIIYDKGTEKRDNAETMITLSEKIEKDIVITFKEYITESCLDSLGGYLAKYDAFPDLKKTRDNCLLEFDYHKQSVAKLTSKPSKNPLSLPRAKEKLAVAKREYETVNEEFKAKMEEIIGMKEEVFSPIFERVCKRLVEYNLQLSSMLADKLSFSRNGKKSNTSGGVKKGLFQKKKTTKSNGKAPKHLDIEWFYLDSKLEQKGPVTVQQLAILAKKKQISANSNVFGGDMDDWAPISKQSDLNNFLGF